MMSFPLVTVAVPTYNSEATISNTLNNLLNQDYEDIEIIICDDVSTDNSYELCKKLTSNNNSVKVYLNNENLGHWNNFYKCIEKGKGKYCVWCCPGDLWDDNFISCLVAENENNKTDVSICGIKVVAEETGETINKITYGSEFSSLFNSSNKLARSILVKPLETRRNRPHVSIHSCLVNRKLMLSCIDAFSSTGPIINERQILCHLAVLSTFSYIDDMHFTKIAHERTSVERASHDPTTLVNLKKAYILRVCFQIIKSFFKNKRINYKNKLYVLVIVGYYFQLELIHKTKIFISCVLNKILTKKKYSDLKLLYFKIRNVFH